jgi:hypothetical protein
MPLDKEWGEDHDLRPRLRTAVPEILILDTLGRRAYLNGNLVACCLGDFEPCWEIQEIGEDEFIQFKVAQISFPFQSAHIDATGG